MASGNRLLRTFALSCLVCSMASFTLAETNWNRFRGPLGTGHSTETGLPTEWSGEDVTWRVDLPGIGQSTPIVWGEKIFLTAAKSSDGGNVQRWVLCLDRKDGSTIWEQQAATGPPEDIHTMNTRATSSCATDGELVFAFFGKGGIHCFTVDGEKKWSRDLGTFPGAWGTAASPILYEDTVIQNCDAEGAAYLIALDKKTGEPVWRTDRRDLPRGGWSTPILIDTGERKELVLNGEFGVQAYNPQTGADLWYCKSFNGRGSPVPEYGNDLVYVVNGKPGDVYAVRPGGSGDVTATHMAWHTPRSKGRDLPAPALVGDVLIVVSMNGIATGYDAMTGDEMWNGRLGGNFSASPLVADGLIYIPDEEGVTRVIKPGTRLDVVAENELRDVKDDEIFRAAITPVDGKLYIRSNQALYCVGKK